MNESEQVVKALQVGIQARLARIGGSVKRVRELEGDAISNLPSARLSMLAGNEAPNLYASLPETRIALTIPPMPQTVLISVLNFDAVDQPDLTSVLWWLALVRAHLDAVRRSDLYAFLVSECEIATSKRSEWCDRVEYDERFCRKFVFRCGNTDGIEKAVTKFLDRTFLAQPWLDAVDPQANTLDPFANAASQLASTSEIGVEEAHSWLAVLERHDLEPSDVADELVQILEVGRGA